MATDPARCEHDRTPGTCEACAHRDALADPRRAPATRDELYPFPEGGSIRTAFLPDDDEPAAEPVPEPKRTAAKRRRS
jgi:hypothetical protein